VAERVEINVHRERKNAGSSEVINTSQITVKKHGRTVLELYQLLPRLNFIATHKRPNRNYPELQTEYKKLLTL
jgi:hypothetical protein